MIQRTMLLQARPRTATAAAALVGALLAMANTASATLFNIPVAGCKRYPDASWDQLLDHPHAWRAVVDSKETGLNGHGPTTMMPVEPQHGPASGLLTFYGGDTAADVNDFECSDVGSNAGGALLSLVLGGRSRTYGPRLRARGLTVGPLLVVTSTPGNASIGWGLDRRDGVPLQGYEEYDSRLGVTYPGLMLGALNLTQWAFSPAYSVVNDTGGRDQLWNARLLGLEGGAPVQQGEVTGYIQVVETMLL